ncbi:siphovirus Gp157 family protein [Staphylococcus coagulans]|uniref:siphovirus Gp157 family protein n=1 Tax=Staphylococcus coagulans TaxID=74706 RepID=UPI001BE9D964|nr:siphovirus Gp157 family protein [Staphylococcus coagulans]MBT2813320.1 siphovirus Gp157 family protein [Staphylococcus coagulans]MBT2815583.1 siphovirus Gp157 family protein [Staphylococcus coagulans]MBT2837028.1 siphovirus Gp157 family protein [Staphylococcus coagulans]MBT2841556.1 siphovirus Gp157 family protein [Staphylococcus coagulans]MBT2849825.1 siphovirus Gp157 family protein [Staphylococcus coagulans]
MSNLYELSEAFKELSNQEELNPTLLKDTLDSIQAEMNVKVDNIVNWRRDVLGDVEVIDKEIKRLQDLKKQKTNLCNRLKEYLKEMLDVQEVENYRTATNHIFKRKNGASKKIIDESLIPQDYWVSQAPKLNSKQLTDDLKAGKDIPGAELQVTESLVIK